jgi:homoserine O-acetyltransferase/O-succinyltransferase
LISNRVSLKNFRFENGDCLPELQLHVTTLGIAKNPAVLILHGTTGSGSGFLNPDFSGELFGPGQPLDQEKYFIILPDAIGAGKSRKPSDGLRLKFPRYNYADMVLAQYRLVTEFFGLTRLRAVIGNSMGGMHAWLWATRYPIMDVAVPMACQPTPLSGRNWMLRRLLIEMIRRDPLWQNGQYTVQPPGLQLAQTFFNVASNGGEQALSHAARDSKRADQFIKARLSMPLAGDANDILYQWESAQDYDPSADLEKISATVLAINSADDERNPPELGVLEREIKRVKYGSYYLIPASQHTQGHATVGMAKFWKAELSKVLA